MTRTPPASPHTPFRVQTPLYRPKRGQLWGLDFAPLWISADKSVGASYPSQPGPTRPTPRFESAGGWLSPLRSVNQHPRGVGTRCWLRLSLHLRRVAAFGTRGPRGGRVRRRDRCRFAPSTPRRAARPHGPGVRTRTRRRPIPAHGPSPVTTYIGGVGNGASERTLHRDQAVPAITDRRDDQSIRLVSEPACKMERAYRSGAPLTQREGQHETDTTPNARLC